MQVRRAPLIRGSAGEQRQSKIARARRHFQRVALPAELSGHD